MFGQKGYFVMQRYFQALFLLFISSFNRVWAANIGVAAEEVLTPLNALSDIVYKICYVIGFVLIAGSVMQYKRHRDNPSEVHLTQPIMMLILGLIVACLPLLPKWLSGGMSG